MGDSSGARSKQRSMSMLVCASSSGNGSSRVAESVSVENSVASFRPSSPKCRSFTFKRTLTYWTAVSFIEGSALFTAWYGFLSIQGAHTAYSDSLMLSPSTFGVAWFLIGSYLGYLHQMNWELGPKMGRCSTWYFAAPWKLPISRAMVCWQSYLAGTFMWIISEVTSFVNWDTVLEEQLFIYVPMTMGGGLFVVAGVCEAWDNAAHRWTLAWFTSWANLFGGVLFLLGSALPIFDPHSEFLLLVGSTWPFFAGSVLFLASSTASLFLWKNDMFELTLSRKLNKVCAEHCLPLSSNTIITNVIYIVSSTIATANLCLAADRSHPHGATFRVSQVFNASVQVVFVHLLLLLTSVITVLPTLQPFRGLILTIRFLSVLMLANVLSTFVTLAWNSPHD